VRTHGMTFREAWLNGSYFAEEVISLRVVDLKVSRGASSKRQLRELSTHLEPKSKESPLNYD
jgi:hypothetical protein